MSKILPINKSLDDRYINQDEKITEQAITQLIDNQGGASSGIYFNYATVQAMVNYYNEFVKSGYKSSLYKTKSEMAALMNITEEQLEQMVRGQIKYVEFDYESYGSIYRKLIPLFTYRIGYSQDTAVAEYYEVSFKIEGENGSTLNINETSDEMFYIAYLQLSNWN